MNVRVGGPNSEIEAEAKKKLITEKRIKEILSQNPSKHDLDLLKVTIWDLTQFYERIIQSINHTIRMVKSKTQMTYLEQKKYIQSQEKELSQAKREKSRLRKYLKVLNEKLDKL